MSKAQRVIADNKIKNLATLKAKLDEEESNYDRLSSLIITTNPRDKEFDILSNLYNVSATNISQLNKQILLLATTGKYLGDNDEVVHDIDRNLYLDEPY